MSAYFHFDVDPDRDLVRITMAGFFTPGDIQQFLAARRVAHRQLRCGRNEHVTLNDLRGMKIQPQDSVAGFRDLLSDPEYRSRRLAFVTDPTLALYQLERCLDGRVARCFSHPVPAEAWLFEADGVRRAVG
jgi:hypothetical protein